MGGAKGKGGKREVWSWVGSGGIWVGSGGGWGGVRWGGGWGYASWGGVRQGLGWGYAGLGVDCCQEGQDTAEQVGVGPDISKVRRHRGPELGGWN